jgi:Lrp/AsnC family leucine-responsive transcriptional regulator
VKDLDDANWRILENLQKNARMTVSELSRRVFLSAPAVAERITKLEEAGYIKGYRTVIDYNKLGMAVPVFVNFKSSSIAHADMVKMVNDMPEVVEWYTVTGNNCMIMKVIVPSTNELDKVLQELSNYGETSTSIILSGNPEPRVVKKNNDKV